MNDTTYTLTRLTDTPEAQVYLMRQPNSLLYSTVFTFLEVPTRRIVITGDSKPGRKGVISDLGYGLWWFLRQAPGPYLCEKFLTQEFHPERAREWVEEKVKEMREELAEDMPDVDLSGDSEAILKLSDAAVEDKRQRDLLVRLASVLEVAEQESPDELSCQGRFYDWYVDTFEDSPEDEGIGYDPREAELLGKLQQRFAKLYRETWPDACKG